MSKSDSPSTSEVLNTWSRRIQAAALILLVLFGVAPVLLAAIPGATSNESFSIYNEDYDGLSVVRRELESMEFSNGDPKYSTTNIVSNLNVLNRFNGTPTDSKKVGALFIAGPAANYGVTETISMILYLLRGGSVIIADDFGTGNQILDPIFDAFENLDKFAQEAQAQGMNIPSVNEIFGGAGDTGTNDSGGVNVDPFSDLPGSGESGVGDAATLTDGDFMTELIGNLILRFGFNSTGILMHGISDENNGHPARAIITDFDDTQIEGYSFTQGIDKVATEFGSIISLKLRVTVRDEFGVPILDENGEEQKTEVWQPLQKLSASLLNEEFGDDSFELSVPFFPMYSSQFSWIETDFQAAAEGTMEPDLDEWGNAKFATALSIPLFPGFGKLVFIADPSIFINRWTSQTDTYDNLQLFKNIIEMATAHQEQSGDPIPILFDFGHTFQGLTSPALYSTAFLKLMAELSMFPLYAPFLLFFAYGYGKRLMPKTRRLRPILLTKRRGESGHSDFEKQLEIIKETGTYGEPIMHLKRRLVREVAKDVRFYGDRADSPRELARFFKENYPTHFGSERELRNQIVQIFRIASHPTRRVPLITARRYLELLKKFNDLLNH